MLRPTRGNSSKEKVLELAALDHKQVGSDRRELQYKGGLKLATLDHKQVGTDRGELK